MVNTSEMVSNERRVEIVDSYAEKLMNSEYPLEQTRNIIIGGLKGYERLLKFGLKIQRIFKIYKGKKNSTRFSISLFLNNLLARLG